MEILYVVISAILRMSIGATDHINFRNNGAVAFEEIPKQPFVVTGRE